MKNKILSHIHGLVKITGLLVYLCAIAFALFFAGCGSTEVVYDTDESRSLPSDEAMAEQTSSSDGITSDTEAPSGEESDPSEDEHRMLIVHLCGAVRNPGVYELDIDSRVIDGINKAGGFSDDASEDSINLAMAVTDGSRIYVPTVEEAVNGSLPPDTGTVKSDMTAVYVSDPALSQSVRADSGAADGKVDLNTADADTLMTLKGIGRTRALSIIEYREEHGGFASIEELMNISGIGQKSFDKLKDEVTVR